MGVQRNTKNRNNPKTFLHYLIGQFPK